MLKKIKNYVVIFILNGEFNTACTYLHNGGYPQASSIVIGADDGWKWFGSDLLP